MSDQDSGRSMLTLKDDDDFRRLGFVGCQTGHSRIAPVGNVYYRPSRWARLRIIIGLYDIQSVAVEEERVVAEQFIQFRNQRMVIGNHLSFELGEGLFDLRGIQFHCADSIGLLWGASHLLNSSPAGRAGEFSGKGIIAVVRVQSR